MPRRSKTKRTLVRHEDPVREQSSERSPWICVRVFHAMAALVSDSPQEGDSKKGKSKETSASPVGDSLATGCLANEIGLASLLIALAPFLVTLLGAAILDVFWFPFRIVRDQLT